MVPQTSLEAAIRALRTELAGGTPADLGREVRELAELLARRARRGPAPERDALEHELLSGLPDAAALVSREGWVRASNSAFDALAATGRAEGLTPLEITRSADLSEAVRRALEGTGRDLDLAIGRSVYQAHLAPLLRGEVLLLLRDVTEARRTEGARRDFAANASHELRTPIAAIGAAAETLLSGGIADLDAARGFVEIIARQAERLSQLTRDLLDLSRIETRQWKLELDRVELEPVARQVMDLLAPAASAKALTLSLEVPDGAAARADPRALEQVLVNLVENAVKYTARGRIVVRAEREEWSWVVAVADTGPGIERHHLPRIFERFYRVDAGRARDLGGTGLGLAIAKHLVQGMKGEIGVESGAGGTRFWFRLPAAA